MSDAKVALVNDLRRDAWFNDEIQDPPLPLKRCLPYFYSASTGRREGYVHRVRSGILHRYYEDTPFGGPHTSLRMWCGVQGFLRSERKRSGRLGGGHLAAEPPRGRRVCATCEGRAFGAGFGSDLISQASETGLVFRPRQVATPRRSG